MKKYFACIILIAFIAGMSIWWLNRQPTLIDLQKAYLFAKNDTTEQEKIIDRLEEYYRNLSVPDSIRRRVDDEITALLDTTLIDVSNFNKAKWDTTNVYHLENQLIELLKTAMIARGKEEDKVFTELKSKAMEMATIVDAGTQTIYWSPLVKDLNGINQTAAITWLKAESAKRLCQIYHYEVQYWRTGELYGALGLHYLTQINDPRIRLDLIQRLQIILYEFYSFTDLSIAIAERYLKSAESINYHLRANGISYHIAEACLSADHNEQALEATQKIIRKAEKYQKVPFMSWYMTNGLLTLAEVYYNLGQYENSILICDQVEQSKLTELEELRVLVTRGRVNRSLSNYEIAESQFKNALAMTEYTNDTVNRIVILEHLGVLFKVLTDFDIALDYFFQSEALTEESNLENYDKIRLLLNIAEVMATTGDIEKYEEYVQRVNTIISLENLPSRKANSLHALGKLNLQLKNYEQALVYLDQANLLYQNSGLLRRVIETNLNIIENLIGLKRYSQAKTMTSETYILANRINEIEGVIDAIAMLAEIEKEQGNIEKAIAASNRLINEIERLSMRFKNTDILVPYRQKIYAYLKKSVAYELHNNRIDSAFVKLDYAKARALKRREQYGNGHTNGKSLPFIFMDIDNIKSRLDDQSIVIDYLVMQDTLYAFVVDKTNLQLYRKKIDQDELKKSINTYKAAINKTINIFNNYNPEAVNKHFNATTKIGQNLYQQLMDWPGLTSRIKDAELIYIIPDEFLYDLPFSTLVADTSDSLTYLVHHAGVVNLPGVSFLNRTIKDDFILEKKRVLISADPSFPATKDFVSNVKRVFPLAEELTVQKQPFTKKNVLEEMKKGYDIYIFIGHGLADNINPNLSFMELFVKSSMKSGSRNIKIFIKDLNGINWPGAEMVLLVGCETAAGKLYRGTGILGLQQGFLLLGTRNVLASLWKIAAAFAIPQAQEVLQSWNYSSNLAMALREIQLKTIRNLQLDNYYIKPHPYFWGNFMLVTTNN